MEENQLICDETKNAHGGVKGDKRGRAACVLVDKCKRGKRCNCLDVSMFHFKTPKFIAK